MVGLDIVRTGRVFPPYLLGEPYLNKPPLHHALCASVIALEGSHDEGTVRLPSVFCGAVAVWLVWLLVSRLAGPRAGLVAAAFLFLSYRFFSLARSTELEILLTAAECVAYLGLSKLLWSAIRVERSETGRPAGGGREAPPRPSSRPRSGWFLAALGVAIACLAKGPAIALVFPVTLLVADAIVSRTWRRLISVGSLVLLLGAVVGTGVYYGPLIVKFGGVKELTNRLAFENVQHAHGFHYYLWQLPLGLLPAGITLPWMLLALRRRDRIPRTCALAVAIGVVIFSLSSSKQSHYLLPLYPLVAVWAGTSGVLARWRPAVLGTTIIVLVGAVVGAAVAKDYVTRHLLRGTEGDRKLPSEVLRWHSRTADGQPLAMMERHPLVGYYLDRPDIEIVEGAGGAAAFIADRRGFVEADLEQGERLAPDLERFRRDSRESEGHTYVLLGPPEKPASGR